MLPQNGVIHLKGNLGRPCDPALPAFHQLTVPRVGLVLIKLLDKRRFGRGVSAHNQRRNRAIGEAIRQVGVPGIRAHYAFHDDGLAKINHDGTPAKSSHGAEPVCRIVDFTINAAPYAAQDGQEVLSGKIQPAAHAMPVKTEKLRTNLPQLLIHSLNQVRIEVPGYQPEVFDRRAKITFTAVVLAQREKVFHCTPNLLR